MRRPTRRLLGSIATVLVAASAFAACKEPSPAQGNRVLLVGDSIFALSRETLEHALTDKGWSPVVQAQAGSAIEHWTDQIQIAIAKSHPNLVVMELGTNDCGTVPCVPLGPPIDALMRQLQFADAVLWLTVQDDALIPDRPDVVNDAIRAAAGRWDNLFVVDMTSLFHGHDDWRKDGTHPNAVGQLQLAKLVIDALEPFRPEAQ